ncbi:hypothetical protein KQY10_10160 [Leptospira interrogans]|uniref:Alpha-glucosidase n=1 Tax=Leptospira interrogans serovar Hardjo str. Norma TaxID=1279460 RepID=A0A0M3TM43_LEPIR|nr:hypothetical protein [Leptospira interrogans]ALE40195.1 alpha-glucosidase [Leptospira interrogans serovar Hardjo str. Norma]ALO01204.1 hypothetical protein LIH_12650 [Leptospira interrogans serovar Hardjo-prajitno]EKO97962.1 hypothetical protein LEP1GSC057_3469 [Leptospira interrogans str. Brem 329]MCD1165957.1 hypothetical protein [Leptospira interrogans]MCH1887030.1 hypothetical protein [Leptospira interrogans]
MFFFKKNYIWLLILNVIQAILLCFIYLNWPENPYQGKTKIGELETGITYCKVAIYVDDFWEHGLPAYYEIVIDQRYVIALTYFTNVDPEKPFADEFEIIKHPKKNLIGLVRKAEPKMLLMMHNFDTNENWPRANFTETYESVRKRGNSMRNLLNPSLLLSTESI